MHDCKIPNTGDQRDADIKKYVEKLGQIERDFADSKKQSGELDEATEEQKE